MRSISAFRAAATDPAVASARRVVCVIRRAGSGGAERGSMSVEMVVLAPVLLMVVLIAVAGGCRDIELGKAEALRGFNQRL